jgi:hypothetical protein
MIHALLLLATALATPPEATLAQLEQALERLADPAQVASFQVATTASYADEDGDDAHVDVVLNRITVDPDGTQHNSTLSHTRDGEPLDEEEEEEGEKKEVGLALALPAGDDLPRYVYGPTTQRDGVAQARFEPAPGEPDADDLATGTVAWDAASGQPLWLSFVPQDLPFLVKRLDTRIEIGATAGKLHTSRIVSAGVGGPPLLRKRFEMDMRFHQVQWR